jgi:hypothetical protein
MSRVSMGALFTSLDAFSAAAMTAEIDTDGDGLALTPIFRESTLNSNEELFREIDVYGDGYVNDEEWVAAIGTRLLAEPQDTL